MIHTLNLIFLYYDNPNMLREQLSCWNAYPDVLSRVPEVLLIDDGSPNTRAADVVRQHGCALPIQVFRIKEDIPWNFAGARNLGCAHAHDWIYISDIDTLLLAEDARKLFEASPVEESRFYLPRMVCQLDLRNLAPGIVNLLYHKRKYLELGGYDEDYAGHYGKEETDFFERISLAATKVYREDVLIRRVPAELIADARTLGRVRDKSRNSEVFRRKLATGWVKPADPLRFNWERVM